MTFSEGRFGDGNIVVGPHAYLRSSLLRGPQLHGVVLCSACVFPSGVLEEHRFYFSGLQMRLSNKFSTRQMPVLLVTFKEQRIGTVHSDMLESGKSGRFTKLLPPMSDVFYGISV
jgi:hypothetical protein